MSDPPETEPAPERPGGPPAPASTGSRLRGAAVFAAIVLGLNWLAVFPLVATRLWKDRLPHYDRAIEGEVAEARLNFRRLGPKDSDGRGWILELKVQTDDGETIRLKASAGEHETPPKVGTLVSKAAWSNRFTLGDEARTITPTPFHLLMFASTTPIACFFALPILAILGMLARAVRGEPVFVRLAKLEEDGAAPAQ